MKAVYIVIPAYNEATVLGKVIDNIKKEGFSDIIVVDDGSYDATLAIAETHGALAVRHRLNRGKGAATKTGIEAALARGAKIIVTMDADDQHNPAEIKQLIEPIADGACDVTLGTRQFSKEHMPTYKILHNTVANLVTAMYAKIRVQDSQSGFRAYSREACLLLDTKTDSYEYESEIIRLIAIHRLSFREIPISVAYTPYSIGKLHKQNISNGIRTVYKMIWNALS